MVVAFLSKRYKWKISGEGLSFLVELQSLTRRPWWKVQLPFWHWGWKPYWYGEWSRKTKPVSLDIALACLNDYLLGFLSLQPNIGKREIKLSLISFQFYKQWWKTSHQTSSSVSTHPLTRISTKEIPSRLSSSSSGVSSFMKFPMEYISIHFSAFSITIVYTPLILT